MLSTSGSWIDRGGEFLTDKKKCHIQNQFLHQYSCKHRDSVMHPLLQYTAELKLCTDDTYSKKKKADIEVVG